MNTSVLGRLRGRTSGDSERGPREDEWFIPYKAAPSLPPPHSGIGASPAPVKQSTLNLLSVFSPNSPSEINKNYRFPRAQAANPASGIQRLLPRHSALYRSPSHNSLIESALMSAQLPSSSSVPTGLAAPKVLFSPLSREIRAGHSFAPDLRDEAPARQRTVSMPKPRRVKLNDELSEARRWAVPTLCDMFVLPRPHITPHVITPPESPDDQSVRNLRVIEDGEARRREKFEWAEYVNGRGRSMSFNHQSAAPGAPIIGSVRARSRENSRNNSLTNADPRAGRLRAGSLGSRWSSRRGSTARGENKSSSFDVNPSPGGVVKSFDYAKPGRSASEGRDIGMVSDPDPPGLGDFDVEDPFHARRVWEQAAYRRLHARNNSQPKQLSSFGLAGQQQDRPQRTLRIEQPPPVNRGGVVVIGPEPSQTFPVPDRVISRHGAQYRHRAPPSLDLSKPLPSLPRDVAFPTRTREHAIPFHSGIGVAVSPEPVPTPTTAPSTGTSTGFPPDSSYSTSSDVSPTKARAFLEKQHQRSMTKRAFQAPAYGPSAYRLRTTQDVPLSASSATFPMSSAAMANSTTSSSDSSTTRRKTALEEAIGRSRASSVGAIDSRDLPPVKFRLRTRPRTAGGEDDMDTTRPRSPRLQFAARSPVSPTFVPSPQLAYPISTQNTSIFHFQTETASSFLDVKRPDLSQGDSYTSGKSAYTDASEGWGRSGGATPTPLARPRDMEGEEPSPEMSMDDRGFHGLFFRTPRDAKNSIDSTSTSGPPFPTALPRFLTEQQEQHPIGLGYEMEGARGRRPSSTEPSDESTIEIGTPVFVSKGGGSSSPCLGYVEPSSMGSASLHGQSMSPQRLLASYQAMRPFSEVSGSGSEGEVPSEGHVTTSRPRTSDDADLSIESDDHPTIIATSPSNPNSPERRMEDRAQSPLSPGLFGIAVASSSTPNLDFAVSSGWNPRHSSVPSFIHDFPNPPTNTSPKMTTEVTSLVPEEKHASAFGQVVTGPPGAGKTTYCHGMHQFLTALDRPVHIINLDPAVPSPPYPCAISITDLLTLDSVMDEFGLGPNGAILYCVEYLEANFDWLVEKLDALLGGAGGDGYVIFDTPGQVELWTNHDSLKRIVERLTKMDYRLAAVHLSDAHYITDASKFISVVLLALRAMMQLEMPHVNVLSKVDLLSTYGELPFDLRYYTECRDLSYLLSNLEKEPRAGKFGALNRAMVELVEDFGLVGFETLAVEDKMSMMKLLKVLDRVTGYVYVPNATSTHTANTHALFSSAMGIREEDLGDVDDVQERWIDRKEEYDEIERESWKRESWKREGETRAETDEE